MGSEFVTGPMKDLYDEHEITRYSTHNTDMKVKKIVFYAICIVTYCDYLYIICIPGGVY